MRFKPYPILTICSLISLAILMWLGNWQWTRYQDKMAIDDTVLVWETIEGRVVPGSEVIAYGYLEGNSAWRRVVALETETDVVYLPLEMIYQIDPPMPCAGDTCPLNGTYASRGLFKTPHGRNAFSTDDEPDRGIYYTLDPKVMGAGLPNGLNEKVSGRVFEPEMIMLTENGQTGPGKNPFARLRLDDKLPPQRHFGYAITWWGLAMALLGVYLAFHYSKGRLRFKKETNQ